MIAPLLEISVAGVPQPQGSKRVFNGVLVEGNDRTLRPWRGNIAGEARAAMGELTTTAEPVFVMLGFLFARPRSHYGTGRNASILKASAPAYKSTKPDVDKLARAVLDALTGIVFVDDSQVASLTAWKDFGPPGVSIRVEFADVFALTGIEGNAAAA